MRRGLRLRLCVLSLVTAASVVFPVAARASSNCGTSNAHILCVTVPNAALKGDTMVTITNDPNSGTVIVTWIPSGKAATKLIQLFAPSPSTNHYSFIWPTEKYLDGSGTLRVQAGSTSATPVDVLASLSNGNVGDFQHSKPDWASFLPGQWTGSGDPTILAVGDGPSNEVTSNAVANQIANAHPPLFLFLGDIYETGTFAENLNHYGVSSLDVPGGGTLWGATANVTQPTLGNHEKVNMTAWTDYWHGRPLFTKFTFGGVLFLDMNSSSSMSTTSSQYQFVQSAVTDPNAPACIVAFWHIQAINGGTIRDGERAIWALLANNGGDLLLTGHAHNMHEYRPMDPDFKVGTAGAHMVELIDGAGGHGLAGASSDSTGRLAWSRGKTAGVLALTLNGAGGGGTANSIGWNFEDVSGKVLRSGSVSCDKVNSIPS